jgi:hypothetical protein
MKIKKVAVNITERDITSMIETICKETQSTQKANNIADLFTELLLKSTEASTLFVQIMLGNGLPVAYHEGDVIRCKWDRLKVGLTNADDIHDRLHENNLINEDNEVICMVKTFRGYAEYFPYVIEFKYGDDLYASCSMGFEDVII